MLYAYVCCRGLYNVIYWYILYHRSILVCFILCYPSFDSTQIVCISISHERGPYSFSLTHWGRVSHLCVSELTIIGSDNGLSPGRRQAIIWTNAVILFIRPLGTNFNEIWIKILTFSFTKMRLKVSSAKWRPICLGLNVLSCYIMRCAPGPITTIICQGNYPAFQRTRMQCSLRGFDCNATLMNLFTHLMTFISAIISS